MTNVECRMPKNGMIYDITPRITPKLAVWPGDTAASRRAAE
jgi:hypothetical protein